MPLNIIKQVEHIIKQIFEINKYWDLKLKYLTSKKYLPWSLFLCTCWSAFFAICILIALNFSACTYWSVLFYCIQLLVLFVFSFLFPLYLDFKVVLYVFFFHLLSINRNENPIQMQSLQSKHYWSNMANLILHYMCIPTKYNLKIKLTQSLWYVNYMGKKSNTQKYLLEKLDNNASTWETKL